MKSELWDDSLEVDREAEKKEKGFWICDKCSTKYYFGIVCDPCMLKEQREELRKIMSRYQ